jgi:hypothetical protein
MQNKIGVIMNSPKTKIFASFNTIRKVGIGLRYVFNYY